MRIYCWQPDVVWEDKAANFKKAQAAFERRSPAPDSVLVLPEMFATGFSMNASAICEPAGGETERFLSELARRHRSLVIGGLAAIGLDGKPANHSLAIDPAGQVVARYAKIFPFSLGGESDNYQAGSQVLTFSYKSWSIAPFICYDLRFPEVFRVAARRGAELMIVIASWPIRRAHHWVNLLQARAIENLAYVVGVNRCGTDPQYTFPGRTLVVDPHGIIIADANDREGVLEAEVDRATVLNWRREFPALRDMRDDFSPGG